MKRGKGITDREKIEMTGNNTEMLPQTTSSTSIKEKIAWAKTARLICYSIAVGLDKHKFTCPIFGSIHAIPAASSLGAHPSMIRVPYRGFEYYVRKVYDYVEKEEYTLIGLILPKDDLDEYRPIIMFTKNFGKCRYFSFDGLVTEIEDNG